MSTGARCSLDSRPRKLGHLPPHHQILPLKSQPQSRSWNDCGGGVGQTSQGSGPGGGAGSGLAHTASYDATPNLPRSVSTAWFCLSRKGN